VREQRGHAIGKRGRTIDQTPHVKIVTAAIVVACKRDATGEIKRRYPGNRIITRSADRSFADFGRFEDMSQVGIDEAGSGQDLGPLARS
jgi:hypothetical protein